MKKIGESNFRRLLGIWKTTGEVISGQENVKLTGTDSYELIVDGNYIMHKANVQIGAERNETLEVIELETSHNKAKMHYFNTNGEAGIMISRIVKNEFKIEGDGLIYNGMLNDENTKIIGKWRIKSNGKWTDFIELVLEKK